MFLAINFSWKSFSSFNGIRLFLATKKNLVFFQKFSRLNPNNKNKRQKSKILAFFFDTTFFISQNVVAFFHLSLLIFTNLNPFVCLLQITTNYSFSICDIWFVNTGKNVYNLMILVYM